VSEVARVREGNASVVDDPGAKQQSVRAKEKEGDDEDGNRGDFAPSVRAVKPSQESTQCTARTEHKPGPWPGNHWASPLAVSRHANRSFALANGSIPQIARASV
jgi:hypothetical protein